MKSKALRVLVAYSDGFQPALQDKCFVRKSI